MNKSEMKAIEIYCREKELSEDQVEYVRTNHCSTGRKIPVTNHLRVCSALGIVAHEKHFLFHLSHPMTSIIIDEMNKQFEPGDFDDIDQNAVRIWLGEDSQFNPGLFLALYHFRILNKILNLESLQNYVRKSMFAELNKENNSSTFDDVLPASLLLRMFLELKRIESQDDVRLCIKVFNHFKRDNEFIALFNGVIVKVDENTIVSTASIVKAQIDSQYRSRPRNL